MAVQKILIADCSDDFCVTLAENFGIDTCVQICRTGNEVLEQIPVFQPDGIVFDLTLTGTDGLAVLQKISETDSCPPILATTRFVSDYIMDTLESLHVGYLMVKPCNTRAVARRMLDMITYAGTARISVPEPRKQISGILLQMGLTPKRRGFQCVREAILIRRQHPGQSITKELYPEVGQRTDATGEQVEHAIRSAIAKAWKNGNRDVWCRYFPAGPDGESRRPSNGEFISRMAESLTGK